MKAPFFYAFLFWLFVLTRALHAKLPVSDTSAHFPATSNQKFAGAKEVPGEAQ